MQENSLFSFYFLFDCIAYAAVVYFGFSGNNNEVVTDYANPFQVYNYYILALFIPAQASNIPA